MSTPNTFPRLLSTGAIAALWQRPVSVVERCLVGVGATPVLSLNSIAYFDSVDVDRALYWMCQNCKRPAATPSNMIYGPPEGPVEFLPADESDDGDDDQVDDPAPPVPQNRLTKILGVNHG